MVITPKLSPFTKSNGTANIQIYIYEEGLQERIKTKHYILPSEWTGSEVNKKLQHAQYINAKVNGIVLSIQDHFNKNTDLTPVELKAWFLGDKNEIKFTPVTYYDHYLKEARAGRILNKRTKEPLSPNTIKAMNTSFHYVEKFYAFKKFSFEQINQEWFDLFVSFMRSLGLGQNTIVKGIKHFKIIKAHAKGRVHNNEFKDYSVQAVKSQKIRLTPEEVEAVINLDLSDSPELIPEHERFQVAYNLILRFGDTVTISEKNIVTRDKRHYLSAFTQKTRKEILLPIRKSVYKILKANNFKIKAVNSASNENLKKLGMKAKINSNVTITEFKNGVKEETVYKKYQLMETHTTRRSAARNLYDAKLDPFIIMTLGGWKSLKQLLEYINIDLDFAASKAVEHPFFD